MEQCSFAPNISHIEMVISDTKIDKTCEKVKIFVKNDHKSVFWGCWLQFDCLSCFYYNTPDPDAS